MQRNVSPPPYTLSRVPTHERLYMSTIGNTKNSKKEWEKTFLPPKPVSVEDLKVSLLLNVLTEDSGLSFETGKKQKSDCV